MKKYICTICGYIYDEDKGIPDKGIPKGTLFTDLPDDWVCPLCGALKSDFKEYVEIKTDSSASTISSVIEEDHSLNDLTELSFEQLSAVCSNLSKGCEKQFLNQESELFKFLADYYKTKANKTTQHNNNSISDLTSLITSELEENFVDTATHAAAYKDRGSLRALTWSEKVTRMLNSLLSRYEKEKDTFITNANVYVCEICGYMYIGDDLPDICPVCKVPNFKLKKIERA